MRPPLIPAVHVSPAPPPLCPHLSCRHPRLELPLHIATLPHYSPTSTLPSLHCPPFNFSNKNTTPNIYPHPYSYRTPHLYSPSLPPPLLPALITLPPTPMAGVGASHRSADGAVTLARLPLLLLLLLILLSLLLLILLFKCCCCCYYCFNCDCCSSYCCFCCCCHYCYFFCCHSCCCCS